MCTDSVQAYNRLMCFGGVNLYSIARKLKIWNSRVLNSWCNKMV